MNRWFFKFMFCLFTSTLIVACTTENIVVAPTFMPATATLANSESTPTSALPTFSLFSTPFPTPTSVGNGPFNVVVGIDEIFPGREWAQLETAQDGNIWLLTDQGIARVSDLRWTVYLSRYEGYLIGMDSTDRAWVISEAGDSISAWDGTKWTTYSGENGWTAVNDPQALNRAYVDLNANNLAELPGQVWISTREDVRLFDGVRWKIIKPEELTMALHTKDTSPIPIFPTLSIKFIQSTGEVWVGECDSEPFSFPDDGSGARWFDGKSWQGKSTPVESGCVHSIQEDKAGNIWMAVNYSLWRFTPSTQAWVNFTLTELSASSHSNIIDIAISDAGAPWIITQTCGAGGGCASRILYHLEGSVWRPVGSTISINPDDVLSDSAGNTWLLPLPGEFGFFQIIDGEAQLLADLAVDDWTIDTLGRIWISGKANTRSDDKISLWLTTP